MFKFPRKKIKDPNSKVRKTHDSAIRERAKLQDELDEIYKNNGKDGKQSLAAQPVPKPS